MPSAKNITIVDSLTQQLSSAKAVVLADYRGLTVAQMRDLRRQVKAAGGSLKIAKNRLIKLALSRSRPDPALPPGIEDALQGPTGIILAFEDEIAPIKALVDYAKTHPASLPQPKAGIWQNKILTAADITTLASLPAQDQLLAQLVGQLQSPAYQLVRTLSANLTNLVFLLSSVKPRQSI